ncbi:MAG: hypothetical protein R8G34_09270 [Paracoccaceae bacterium]|nr:hypothetical protein [Paracoccaceae bacterium]
MDEHTLVTEAEIETAYSKSSNTIGWRLLCSPSETLRGSKVAFIGLNPGGRTDPLGHPRFATPHGSAYETESWANASPGQNALQRQVRGLFQRLNVQAEQVLAGNLVPFRSPSWADLPDQKSALAFGRELWTRILMLAQPKLIVSMGREVNVQLRKVLSASAETRIPVAWGRVTGSRAEFNGGVLVGLPHLSRFPIIGRAASEPGLSALFRADWRK